MRSPFWSSVALAALLLAGCGGAEDGPRKADPLPRATAGLFAFDRDASLESAEDVVAKEKAFVATGISYASPGGDRVTGIVVQPTAKSASPPGVVFMHGSGGSRTDFVSEAAELAVRGAVALTIDSPFSRSPDPDTREGQVDLPVARELLIRTAQDLVRGLDLLVSRYRADPARLAIVGYSMGVQAAAQAAALDARVKAVVLMAGRATPSTAAGEPDWARELEPIDTIHFVGHLAPARVLLQGGKSDEVIPRAQMEALYAETSEPKQIRWYDGGHGLAPQADLDRLRWLSDELGLR